MGEKSTGEKADIPGGVSQHIRGLQTIKQLFDSLVKISLLSGHLLKPLCSGFFVSNSPVSYFLLEIIL